RHQVARPGDPRRDRHQRRRAHPRGPAPRPRPLVHHDGVPLPERDAHGAQGRGPHQPAVQPARPRAQPREGARARGRSPAGDLGGDHALGLKLDIEPQVHLDGQVAIRVALEVSTASNRRTTANGTTVYDIGTRNASTTLRLADGETQMLMGLIRDDDRTSAAKVPGLGDLPVLGRLFSNNIDDRQKTEIILSITPRVVRNVRRADAQVAEFWSGTEAAFRTQPIALKATPSDVPSIQVPAAPTSAAPASALAAAPASPAVAAAAATT